MDAVALTYPQARALHELLRAGKTPAKFLEELQPVQAGMFGPDMAERAKQTEVDLRAAVDAITPRPAGTSEAFLLAALRKARAAILGYRLRKQVPDACSDNADDAIKAIDAILLARGERIERYTPRED